MSWVRSALFLIGFVVLTAIAGVLFPSLLFQRSTRAVSKWWARASMVWLKLTCGITSEIRGPIPAPGSLVACKHQSTWDTLTLLYVLDCPVFVLKRSLYYIPVFGWYLWRLGQIAINRSDKRQAMQIITQQAKSYSAVGRTIIIFPEGTRIPPGQERPFQAGVARISADLAMPVVPAALNAGRFWPKTSLKKKPGHAVLEFMPAIPACGDDARGWLNALQIQILGKTAELGG